MASLVDKLVRTWRTDPDNYEQELEGLLGVITDENGYRCIRDPVIRPRRVSILDCAEAFIGREGLRAISGRPYGMRGGRARLVPEADWRAEDAGGGAIGPSHFGAMSAWLATTAGLFGAELLDQYNVIINPARQLVDWKMDVRVQEPMIARYGMPSAPAEDLQPSQEFPSGDLGSDWIRAARMRKQGEALPIAWEAAHFDWTDTILGAAEQLAQRLAITVDERIERGLWGVENTYNRQGTVGNTYRSSGTFINIVPGNQLVNTLNLDKAEQALLSQKDPITGLEIEPVSPQRILITNPAYRMTAERLANPLGVSSGALSSPEQIHVSGFYMTFQVYTSKRAVRILTSAWPGYTPLTVPVATDRWLWGDPKMAFQYRSAKDVTTHRFDITDSPSLARRDVLMELDASEMGSLTIREPRAMTLNTNP
jgi:hypothetical protein